MKTYDDKTNKVQMKYCVEFSLLREEYIVSALMTGKEVKYNNVRRQRQCDGSIGVSLRTDVY